MSKAPANTTNQLANSLLFSKAQESLVDMPVSNGLVMKFPGQTMKESVKSPLLSNAPEMTVNIPSNSLLLNQAPEKMKKEPVKSQAFSRNPEDINNPENIPLIIINKAPESSISKIIANLNMLSNNTVNKTPSDPKNNPLHSIFQQSKKSKPLNSSLTILEDKANLEVKSEIINMIPGKSSLKSLNRVILSERPDNSKPVESKTPKIVIKNPTNPPLNNEIVNKVPRKSSLKSSNKILLSERPDNSKPVESKTPETVINKPINPPLNNEIVNKVPGKSSLKSSNMIVLSERPDNSNPVESKTPETPMNKPTNPPSKNEIINKVTGKSSLKPSNRIVHSERPENYKPVDSKTPETVVTKPTNAPLFDNTFGIRALERRIEEDLKEQQARKQLQRSTSLDQSNLLSPKRFIAKNSVKGSSSFSDNKSFYIKTQSIDKSDENCDDDITEQPKVKSSDNFKADYITSSDTSEDQSETETRPPFIRQGFIVDEEEDDELLSLTETAPDVQFFSFVTESDSGNENLLHREGSVTFNDIVDYKTLSSEDFTEGQFSEEETVDGTLIDPQKDTQEDAQLIEEASFSDDFDDYNPELYDSFDDSVEDGESNKSLESTALKQVYIKS